MDAFGVFGVTWSYCGGAEPGYAGFFLLVIRLWLVLGVLLYRFPSGGLLAEGDFGRESEVDDFFWWLCVVWTVPDNCLDRAEFGGGV